MAVDRMTYQQLDDVLSQLGFVLRRFAARNRTWLHYEHPDSGTEIILVEKNPSELVYQANALAARRQLIENGLVNEKELDLMLLGTTERPPRGARK
jgi:hypothetical protein